MDICVASLADYADVSDLLQESRVRVDLIPDHMEDCLLLRSGRNLVGVAHVRMLGDYALGLCLVIRPGFRRMGLGKQLGLAMLEHTRKQGALRLFIYSDVASFYFRTLGFRPVAFSHIPGSVADFLSELREGAPLIGNHLLEFQSQDHSFQAVESAELKIEN